MSISILKPTTAILALGLVSLSSPALADSRMVAGLSDLAATPSLVDKVTSYYGGYRGGRGYGRHGYRGYHGYGGYRPYYGYPRYRYRGYGYYRPYYGGYYGYHGGSHKRRFRTNNP